MTLTRKTAFGLCLLFAARVIGQAQDTPLFLKGGHGPWFLNRTDYLGSFDKEGGLVVTEYGHGKGGPYFKAKHVMSVEEKGSFVSEDIRVVQKGGTKCQDLRPEKKRCIKMRRIPEIEYNRTANLLGMEQHFKCVESSLAPQQRKRSFPYVMLGTNGIEDSLILKPDRFLTFYLENLHALYSENDTREHLQKSDEKSDSVIVETIDACAAKSFVDLPYLNARRTY